MTAAAAGPAAPRSILGVPVHPVTSEQTLQLIESWLSAGERARMRHICTVNPEFIMTARRQPPFRAVLQASDLNVPDGVGVTWALRRLTGRRAPERVTGADLVPRIAEVAAQRGWRLFLLGAAPGVAARAAAALVAQAPGLMTRSAHGGTPAREHWQSVQDELAAFRPHILLVAFGHPRQDLWIAEHRQDLRGMVAMGVGGTLDFLAGEVRRAPRWMRRLGLEWLFRLLLQPRRWLRMTQLPNFAFRVLYQALFRGRAATRP